VNHDSVIVILESWEDQRAITVGTAVHYANVNKTDQEDYDGAKLQPNNLQVMIDSARAEIGVAKAYGAYWHGGHWDSSEHNKHRAQNADITLRRLVDGVAHRFGIEVKHRISANVVPIDPKDYENNHLIVWASVHQPNKETSFVRVEILGEARASDVWHQATLYNPNSTKQLRRKFDPQLLKAPSVMKGDYH